VKSLLKAVGVILVVVASSAVCLLVLMGVIFRNSYPPQPKFGFGGDWRVYSELGLEERSLPTATNIWADYSRWKPKSEHGLKMYVACLGGSARQQSFHAWHSRGDTPLGAQDYTNAEFIYEDSHYGRLILSWTLRGKHNADFLKFDDSFRLYQLIPYGDSNSFPPKLMIYGIEGVRPEFDFPQRPTNAFVLSPQEIAQIKNTVQPFKLNVRVK
jgi:hypothetical protein